MTSAKNQDAKVSRGNGAETSAAESPRPASFEEGLATLADLVGRLEGGQLGLAESIAAYESGVRIVRSLHAELADVEQRVRLLTAPEADSEEGAEDPAESAPTGGRRGSARKTRSRAPDGAPSGTARDGTGASTARTRKLPGMDDAESEV